MLEIIKIELKNLSKDKFLLFMYFIMPLFVGLFIYNTLSIGIVRGLPIGILNLDNSKISRDIVFDINSSPTLKIHKYYSSMNKAKDDLSSKEIYALVAIPKDLEKNAKLNITTNISIYYNAQLVFIGKNIQSALTQILSNQNIKLKFQKNIIDSKNTNLALTKSIEVMPNIIALYNKNSNFSQFILPALIPCLWQLFIILCMIGIIAYDERDVGFIKNRQNEIIYIYRHLFIKITINTIIFFVWWIIIIISFYKLSYIHSGNLAVLAINALITILAYNSIGIFLYSIIRSHTRSISVAAVYAAPSLAFVGITYPINNMEAFASFWGKILPITKYLEVYIQQANYGVDIAYSLELIAYNLIFLLFGILGILLYKKKVALL
ncbi:ABC transporter permease [Helicobacter sp. MIT 14-3879]|uniref:ABC transporter permease n=1 Tax=Helicobacter sp. MIT 14-3879 TaxID=2040649 RepID=UPI000E1F8D8F|nr:ABC transporter permease [Helicobacter sp. MIT 14-3879]RDU62083.1 ABC transporter permease [Helicobacter sp. MIT 14-3879]